VASVDWVGIVAVGRATVVAVVAVVLFGDELLGLLLQAATKTATMPMATAAVAFRYPRRVIMCLASTGDRLSE
jgi:hypothetical protein